MAQVPPVSSARTIDSPSVSRRARGVPDGAMPKTPRGQDRVEISAAAQEASRRSGGEGIRRDLVARVRAQIAAGTYETPQKIDQAIDAVAKALACERE